LLQKVAVESQHTVPPWQVWPWLHTLLPHMLWPGCRHWFCEQVLPEGQHVPARSSSSMAWVAFVVTTELLLDPPGLTVSDVAEDV
jgi:hypothetical protein